MADYTEMSGYAAAVLVALTFGTSSMVRLRFFALLSNISFISYAHGAHLLPILLLHGFLLPVNITMLWRALRERRRTSARDARAEQPGDRDLMTGAAPSSK